MALAGRSTRRGGGHRWLAVALVVTIVVVLIDASIKSRSPQPTRNMAGQEWVDAAYRIVGNANVAAKDLSGFLAGDGTVTASAITTELSSMASSADGALRSFRRLRAPADLGAASGLLYACLLERARATSSIASAVGAELRSPASTAAAGRAASTLAASIQRLEVADQAYALFAGSIPRALHDPAPTSKWVRTPEKMTTPTLDVFLTSLRNRTNLSPTHRVAIEAVSTTPAALTATAQGLQILTDSPDLTVTVVVGNTGNQTESGLTVSAAITPAAPTGTSSARDFVTSLAPGASRTVSIGYLNPPQGQKVTLTVTVTPTAGSPLQPRKATLRFEMPAAGAKPPASSTSKHRSSTTTTPTTTIPGSPPST
jgi:hypothetical protein